MAYLYKNQLQVYAQKRNLNLPVYTLEREGPPHACRFKSKVMLEGKMYESLEYYSTVKDAENAAAKVALMSISSDDGAEEEDPAFYKNLLQELTQKEYSCLPGYTTTRSGPSHNPIFSSTVDINGVSFNGQEAKTKKLAEMKAAKVAYIALRESKWRQSSGAVLSGCHVHDALCSPVTQLIPATESTDRHISAPDHISNSVSVEQISCNKDMGHLYKNQLQVYAQKRNLNLPVYTSEREGPPHDCRFKSKVMLEGKMYESLEYYSTVKDAENAAAKVALMSISSDDGAEEDDPAFYKSLLQELAQKEYSCLPGYTTTRSGPSHNPIFSSTVDINGVSFNGQEAKTKKLAEMNAAKVAYIALRESKGRQSSGAVLSGYQAHDAICSPMTQLIPATESTDRRISAPDHISNSVSVEQINCNKGTYHQDSEAKHNLVKPEFHTNLNQNTSGVMVDTPVQPPSRSGIGEISEPSVCSDASPSYKKIKVFPIKPNMTLPTGATIMRRDDKWVAMTIDDANTGLERCT